MTKMIKGINIWLGCEIVSREDLAIALRMIADATENGSTRGICGWSTINYEIEESEKDEEDEREER